jgi:RecB family exonuclease
MISSTPPAHIKVQTEEEVGPQAGLVPSWSYSALSTFEECPYRIYLTRVKKHKEAKNEAADRGTQIHTLAEEFVTGQRGNELPQELAKFRSDLGRYAAAHNENKIEVEQEWAFDINWEPTDWFADNVWGRVKLDVFLRDDPTSAELVDYKTGKRFGNEIKHLGQGQIYAVAAFMRYPELQFLKVRFLYLDHGEVLEKTYTRERAMVFLPTVHKRAIKLTSAKEFKPRPSTHVCRWCPHKESGVCQWAEK